MDLLRDRVRPLYFRYLAAAFGSTFISSIYSVVDMAVVGQYHGPEGTAALAVVAPVWNVIYSLGLLNGIGGSVWYGLAKGRGSGEENRYFTTALLGAMLCAAVCWAAVVFWDEPLLTFFGAEGDLLPMAQAYLGPIQYVVPVFLLSQMLSAFLRSDGAPGLATAAVLSGGIFNIFGDVFFVFGLDMGIRGAGLATAIGAVITLAVALSHFFRKSCTLALALPVGLPRLLGRVWTAGFSAFLIDVAMGVLTILFNRQIMAWLGTDALAVYGVIVNISTFVQCCGYSVGQAAQPILSFNFGAGRRDRMAQVLKYALCAAAVFGLVWTAAVLAFPNGFVSIFMKPEAGVLAIAPAILRTYGLSFLLLPCNVFFTYYFQSVLRPGSALFLSVLRGLALSGGLILTLPTVLGADALWLAMPITEAVTFCAALVLMGRAKTLTKS